MITTGNTVLITGGSSGIGLSLAKRFLSLQNTVIITGRDTTRLQQVKNDHPGMVTFAGDLTELLVDLRLLGALVGLLRVLLHRALRVRLQRTGLRRRRRRRSCTARTGGRSGARTRARRRCRACRRTR